MADEAPSSFPWEDCIERVRANDQRAARDLVAALQPTVFSIVRGRLPRGVAEEDLAQEVFMKVFTRLDQFRSEMPFEHWVCRIAVNTCIDALRRQARRPELRRADLSVEEEALWDRLHVDSGQSSPGETLAARELVARLLSQLTPRERMLIEWVDLEGKGTAEVCALTGWSKMILKVRLFRARRRLKTLLDKLERKETR
ncbi:MAG: sigma-70 family RNA polymerase sigma factor [Opitutaceae bacterium]|nr:sigma-70 family RNA polymerase sigma factor [Opitutaceae bacterium]